MTLLIEDVIAEWMPGSFYNADRDTYYRLTYLRDNVIRVEPANGEAARTFVIGVTVREVR